MPLVADFRVQAPSDLLRRLGAPNDMIQFAARHGSIREVWDNAEKGEWLEWLLCRVGLGALVHDLQRAYDAAAGLLSNARDAAVAAENRLYQAALRLARRQAQLAIRAAKKAYEAEVARAQRDVLRVVAGAQAKIDALRAQYEGKLACAAHVLDLAGGGVFAGFVDGAVGRADEFQAALDTASADYAGSVRSSVPWGAVESAVYSALSP